MHNVIDLSTMTPLLFKERLGGLQNINKIDCIPLYKGGLEREKSLNQ